MAECVLGSASGLMLSPITVSIIVSGSESRRYLSMYRFASTMSGAMKKTTASYPPVPKITFSVVHSSHPLGHLLEPLRCSFHFTRYFQQRYKARHSLSLTDCIYLISENI